MPATASPTGAQVPWSQISTVPAAVLAGGDDALEIGVFERMVLHMHGEALVVRV